MDKYKFTVVRTYNGCTGYQNVRHYEVVGEYFTAKIKHFGNQGFDVPQVIRTDKGSCYFHSVNTFMKEFYKGNLYNWFSNYKDGEQRVFELERYF